MTPEGVQRTSKGEGKGSALFQWLGLGLVVLLAAGVGYATVGGGSSRTPGSAATAETARPQTRLGSRSIAVLPFEALGQKEPGPFTEGMHDALLTRLSNVSGLTVISRQSVQQYRGSEKTTADIARELGVKWVMEGGVQEMGDQIQVNAQLIDASTDANAWAESYRRKLTTEDLFALQTEITKKIARSLETELSREEQKRVERRPTESLEAYRLYMRGRSLSDQRTEAELRSALDYFQRAIREDSSYALAWSGLADVYASFWYYKYVPPNRISALALRAARRAVELGPGLGEAHASLGIVRALRQQGPSALEALTTAVKLTPSHPEAHANLSWVRLLLGRPGQSVEPARRAVELDPTAPAYRVYLAEALLANGRYREALDQAREARSLRREYGLAHFMTGLALHHLGRYREAEKLYEQARSLVSEEGTPSHAEIRAATAAARAARGDRAGAGRMLSQIDERRDPFSAFVAHASLGEVGHAFEAARRVRDWGSFTNEHIRYFFPEILGPLRDDARFEELRRRLDRAWGLNPDGSLPDSVDVSFEAEADD